MNVKLFNFVSRVCDIFKTRFCKTRLLVQDKSNECKCGLNESVCNSKKKKRMIDGRRTCNYTELDD